MFSPCTGLNENAPHRIIHLKVWFLAGGTILGKSRRRGLAGGGVSLGREL